MRGKCCASKWRRGCLNKIDITSTLDGVLGWIQSIGGRSWYTDFGQTQKTWTTLQRVPVLLQSWLVLWSQRWRSRKCLGSTLHLDPQAVVNIVIGNLMWSLSCKLVSGSPYGNSGGCDSYRSILYSWLSVYRKFPRYMNLILISIECKKACKVVQVNSTCNCNPMLSSFPVNQPSLTTNNQGGNMRSTVSYQ